MHKPTFSLDCSDAAEHLDLPPTEFRELEGFHLVGTVADTVIVCLHATNGATQVLELPTSARECLPDDDALGDHFQRLLMAPHN